MTRSTALMVELASAEMSTGRLPDSRRPPGRGEGVDLGLLVGPVEEDDDLASTAPSPKRSPIDRAIASASAGRILPSNSPRLPASMASWLRTATSPPIPCGAVAGPRSLQHSPRLVIASSAEEEDAEGQPGRGSSPDTPRHQPGPQPMSCQCASVRAGEAGMASP
jgi:hypothetical protein